MPGSKRVLIESDAENINSSRDAWHSLTACAHTHTHTHIHTHIHTHTNIRIVTYSHNRHTYSEAVEHAAFVPLQGRQTGGKTHRQPGRQIDR